MMYRYWFANLTGIGNKKKLDIIEYIHEPEVLYRLNEASLKKLPCLNEQEQQVILQSKRSWKVEDRYAALEKRGIKLITWDQETYPEKLRFIHNPPYALYFKGQPFVQNRTTVAIVGARLCSEYGRIVARKLGELLAAYHIDVISGLAEGIDTAGHTGALHGQGTTYAVLGSGVEVCYPQKNMKLYQAVQEQGCIISEQAIDQAPRAVNFPQRNRIISGLSDCIIVVEARKKSGALITADFGLEQGKDIYAVPGRITDELSYGTNYLIKQGAGILSSFQEFLLELSSSKINLDGKNFIAKKHLTNIANFDFLKLPLEKCEKLVYSCVDLSPKNLDQLYYETQIEFSELVCILAVLQRKGYVKELYKNYYVKQDISMI